MAGNFYYAAFHELDPMGQLRLREALGVVLELGYLDKVAELRKLALGEGGYLESDEDALVGKVREVLTANRFTHQMVVEIGEILEEY